MGEIVAVLSGKGGTGKTSVCAGVASSLAVQGRRVLCIDCDVGLRNLDLALGLGQESIPTFADCYGDAFALSDLPCHPRYPSLQMLTAPVRCKPEDVDTASFGKLLSRARSLYDFIFLDAPAGLDLGFRLAAHFADRVILVTGADPASVRDAERTAQELELMGKHRVQLIVNRVTKALAETMGLTVDDIMDSTGVPLLGIVPEDPAVVLSCVACKPVLAYTSKGASAAFGRIAKRLQGYKAPVSLKR